ncbi:MAG: 50S ribosomal protein L14e [Candidatus Micrarchaeia archaeon]
MGAAICVGRVCLKKAGRDAGKRCVITQLIDQNYVEILSAGRKKARRCNILHLEPLSEIVDVSDAAAVKKALTG